VSSRRPPFVVGVELPAPAREGDLACVTAYTLGLRRAFDASDIAAIDNVTRKLMMAQQRPVAESFKWSVLDYSRHGQFFLTAQRRIPNRRAEG